jgi:uncharacterized protein YutE (UPF0331/DUF86 family)
VVNQDLIAAKLADLADRLERVRSRRSADAADLATDRDALDLVSFNLMLAVQICADICSHVIADEGWPAATTLAAGFNRLRDQGVLAASTAAALCRAVGLRNVVAHGYAAVNPAMVHVAAWSGLDDLKAFAREVARWAANREDAGA